jgi:hypothetical protein
MAKADNSTIIQLRQPLKPAMSGAERARNYRLRKKAKAGVTVTSPVTAVTSRVTLAQAFVTVAAVTLAATGAVMNAWYARSLGSSDVSGWLFLLIGGASDMAALAIPSCAAACWARRQRAVAVASWLIWIMTFSFAVTAGVGFSSTNISDVTMARASRVTPAVTAANAALSDAMAARDRECKGGVGRFCRDREAAVVTQRAALEAATRVVAAASDPQAQAAVRMVAWISAGRIEPSEDDFQVLRLVLLTVLPQIGGVLLMIGRAK